MENKPTTDPGLAEAKGGYSYGEKLSLIAQGLMDPKVAGLQTAEEAQLKILGKAPPQEKLGDWMTFEASVVPVSLRARWARNDLKIVPTDPRAWEADWCEKHKGEHSVQAHFRSGSLTAVTGQVFADPILGFCEMLRNTALMLEKKYTELKENDPNPIETRDAIAKQVAEETLPPTAPEKA